MKKVLILGSAGFIMSNFLRYILYRSKEYFFVSIDKFLTENYHMIYLHRQHNFYVGDACDKDFLKKIINMEKPDSIIIGTGNGNSIYSIEDDLKYIITPTMNIFDEGKKYNKNIQIIQIIPEDYILYGNKEI